MKTFENIEGIQAILQSLKNQGKSIGFVPTMGALHEGHLSLIQQSKKDNDYTVVSIYVNPTQFDNASDLEKYPRTLTSDQEKLESVACDFLFFPNNEMMYPKPASLTFGFGMLEKTMEGGFRDGHFNGVALVVSKLFHIIQPNRAYFGQKDLQQTRIIKALVDNLFFNLELIICPIKREEDGLAMSSRNVRLLPACRQQATALSQALALAKELALKGTNILAIKEQVATFLKAFDWVKLEYFEIVKSDDLSLLTSFEGVDEIALCIAAYLGEIRLIDNMLLQL